MKANKETALLIYNPRSGQAYDRDIWLGTIIDKLCIELNYAVMVGAITDSITASQVLEQHLTLSPKLILAGGGDGTIRQVLGSLSESKIDIPVALIPFGTGNQLARNLKIYEENLFVSPLSYSIELISKGKNRAVDLGKMNGNYFCVAVGVGPISDAILTPSQEDKENWGLLAYVASMIQQITSPAVHLKILADDDIFEVKTLGVIVSNVGDMGFATISEKAKLDDGYLDLCIITLFEFTDYLKLGFKVASSVIVGNAPFYIKRVKKIKIESLSGPLKVNIDGDACGETPLNISVIPKAVKIICPEKP